jgi:hypothetical protein
MYQQVWSHHRTCDFCGAMTRGRRFDAEPNVIRCGACHFPLSEGRFEIKAQGQVVKVDETDTAHRAVCGVRQEFGPEWIGLAGQWQWPTPVRPPVLSDRLAQIGADSQR